MKEEGVRPDLTTYTHLLQACIRDGLDLEARAIFEDMLAVGLNPTRQHFHLLLDTMRFMNTRHMWDILESMRRFDISLNEQTYEIVILRYVEAGQIELALQQLSEMGKRSLSPTLKTARGLIMAASRSGYPRLALELAESFEQSSVRHLEGEVWVDLLISCSESFYEYGVLRTWQQVVHELGITPDEGCCLQVLHTAGRHGKSALALDVLQVLERIGASWQEYHFAPIIEALCRDDKVKDALAMLGVIRSRNIIPVTETTFPIFTAISHDTDTVDEAWGHLEAIRDEGKEAVDVTALNVVIQASVAIGDLQRAVGTYKAAGDLNVTPNVDTYNLLLAGCIAAQHRQLGDRLLSEMKDAKIKPDVRTYERLIVLCLTQTNYEDAFFYLEEMKALRFMPPLAVYEAIIRKCVLTGDTRSKIAIEEMTESGYYTISTRLKAFIDSGGSHDPAGEPVPGRGPPARRDRQRSFFRQAAEEVEQGLEEVLQAKKTTS